jgi:hypothetical protein
MSAVPNAAVHAGAGQNPTLLGAYGGRIVSPSSADVRSNVPPGPAIDDRNRGRSLVNNRRRCHVGRHGRSCQQAESNGRQKKLLLGHLNEIGFYPNWREASVARGQLIDLICPFAGGLIRAKIPFVGRCPLLTFCGGTSALFAARKAAIRRTCSSRRPGRCFHAGRRGWR